MQGHAITERESPAHLGNDAIGNLYARKGHAQGITLRECTQNDEHDLAATREVLAVMREVRAGSLLVMEHMILTHHYEPEFGSPKKPMFPEAEILHYLDMIDARMYDMEETLYGIKPGAFSERIRTLDNRRMYRPAFMKKIK